MGKNPIAIDQSEKLLISTNPYNALSECENVKLKRQNISWLDAVLTEPNTTQITPNEPRQTKPVRLTN